MAREIRPEGGISHAPVHNDLQPFLLFFCSFCGKTRHFNVESLGLNYTA